MVSKHADYDVVVIGAGVNGCTAARELAHDHQVLVLDKDGPGSKASGLAAGNTTPSIFYYETPEAAQYANEYFLEMDGVGDFEFTERPRLELVHPEEEEDAREYTAEMAEYGFPREFRDSEWVEDNFSLFDMSEFIGVIEIGDGGYVDDPYVYSQALAEDAAARGAEFQDGVEVTGLLIEGGEVAGVETASGDIEADYVVCAAGWQTPDIVSPHLELPVRPFLLQCVTLATEADVSEDFTIGRWPKKELYWRPQRNGRIRLGGGEYVISDADEVTKAVYNDPSFEDDVTAGDLTAQEIADVLGAEADFRDYVRKLVPRFLHGFDEETLSFENGWAGVGSATPDTRPIIDAPSDGPDDLAIVTGSNGLGVTTSPIAGALVRSFVTGEPAPFSEDQFTLERFDSYSPDFDLKTTFDMGRIEG